jgi:2-dehydro-3-deoxyphosphogluconate aldolase/(4S)-4-hydroxy-2-oxoglutarate aldolase
MNDFAVARALRQSVAADTIRRHRLIVVLRNVAPRPRLVELVDELDDVGARIFEITFDCSTAADDVADVKAFLARRMGGPYLVGAGTVLHATHLEGARRAGADFAVSPLLNPDLVLRSVNMGLPFIAGALTPTEIQAAWLIGATFVKLFPASAVGPQMVRELRGPLPEIELIPTGGIDESSGRAFVNAGAVAVGVGSAIVRAEPDARRALVQALAR